VKKKKAKDIKVDTDKLLDNNSKEQVIEEEKLMALIGMPPD
jgi:hypothetical protein